MKKVGVLFSLLLIISFSYMASAAENITNSSVGDGKNFEKGFVCLENALKSDCSGASSVEDLALSILASPANLGDVCINRLLEKQKFGECWTNSNGKCAIKETALAILALKHAGEKTEKAEEWLLKNNLTSDDLIWYLQQDSNGKSDCKFTYEGSPDGYTITAFENKKLSGSAGPCLSLASGSFWLQISSKCYDREFLVECNENFLATLFYRQRQDNTLYILDGTKNAPAFDTISLTPKSTCFGLNGVCDYEGTVWAALALLETGHSVEDYIPYIVAMGQTNKEYLPNAFNFLLTEEEQYKEELIKEKGELNDYWALNPSVKGKYYDTALAYLAIKKSGGQIANDIEGWFGSTQKGDGCWKNSKTSLIKDTAITLWALEGRGFIGGGSGLGTSGATRCTAAGFYCLKNDSCSESNILENYFCGISTDIVCCKEAPSCTIDLKGVICPSAYQCDGETQISEEGNCCLGECIEETDEETECESKGNFCKSSCSENQVEVNLDCGDYGVCCELKKNEPGSSLWIWILIILVILVLGIIGWLYRAKLKLEWFKIKSKFRKDKGGKGSNPNKPMGPQGGMPMNKGFPPVRRPPMAPPRMQHQPQTMPSQRSLSQLNETFKKLKKFSK